MCALKRASSRIPRISSISISITYLDSKICPGLHRHGRYNNRTREGFSSVKKVSANSRVAMAVHIILCAMAISSSKSRSKTLKKLYIRIIHVRPVFTRLVKGLLLCIIRYRHYYRNRRVQ